MMKAKNDRTFELKLGKKALVLFILGISFFLFAVFLLGVRVGKIMDAHPETVAMGLPYVVMECFGWTPKKVDPDVAISETPKELAPEEEDKPDLTFYDTLANKKKDTKIAEKVMPEKSPAAVIDKPSQQVNTEATAKNTAKQPPKANTEATAKNTVKQPQKVNTDATAKNTVKQPQKANTELAAKSPVKASEKSSAPAVKETYQLQVISLKEKGKADELYKKITKLGYSPRIITTDLKERGKWYRVVINGYSTQEQAQKAKNILSKKISGLNCVIRKKND
jgi:DedD protein